MSEATPGEPQFERMESIGESAPSACASCRRAIDGAYFEAAGRIFCETCRNAVMGSLSGGSGAARLAKALVLGTGAAAVSAVVWYGITKLSGYELGIVAIAVGFAVGFAVRTGAEHRGGWVYQTIAVVLTYLAIAASYVPFVMEGFREEAANAANQAREVDPAADLAGGAEPPEIDETALLVGSIAVSVAIPVLQVTQGTGFIGLLIVGFALYEAWKINKRQKIEFSGPFQLQRTT